MGQDLEKIKNTYNAVAKEYSKNFLNDHAAKPMDREMLKRFTDEISVHEPVWDFGCGTGQTVKYLQSLDLHVSGLDLSEKMLKEARALNPEHDFLNGNLLDLNFNDDSIAGIVSFYAMVHFTEDQALTSFQEIFRVLKPGGLLLFTFHVGKKTILLTEFLGQKIDIDFMFFTTSFITDCLEETGFKNIETYERDPYPDVEYQSRRAYLFARKPE